jgi:hypothetical protein
MIDQPTAEEALKELEVLIGDWTMEARGEPFAQRFTAKISDDGNRIEGRWEAAKDGSNWETDFDLVYTGPLTDIPSRREEAAPAGGPLPLRGGGWT